MLQPDSIRKIGPVRIERHNCGDLFEVHIGNGRSLWFIYFQNAPGWWFIYLTAFVLVSWDRWERRPSFQWYPD